MTSLGQKVTFLGQCGWNSDNGYLFYQSDQAVYVVSPLHQVMYTCAHGERQKRSCKCHYF